MQFRNKLTGLRRNTERLYLEGQLDLYQYNIRPAAQEIYLRERSQS